MSLGFGLAGALKGGGNAMKEDALAKRQAARDRLKLEMQMGHQKALQEDDQDFKREMLDRQTPKDSRTSAMKEYQVARSQGFDGSFLDYQKALKDAGSTKITMGGGKYGTIPPGYELIETEQGAQMVPIPGGPAFQEAEKAKKAAEVGQQSKARSGNVVLEDIDRTLQGLDEGLLPTSGAVGGVLANVPGTQAYDVGQLIETIKANSGFDRLQAMRDSSPTGGALGAINKSEMDLLQAALGNLSQSQSAEQLKYNLERVKGIYLEIIHGPNAAYKDGSDDQNSSAPTFPTDENGWMTTKSGVRIREKR